MQDTMQEKLKTLLKAQATDGKISCDKAWSIADELGATKAEVGQAADDAGLRINNCQLGCF